MQSLLYGVTVLSLLGSSQLLGGCVGAGIADDLEAPGTYMALMFTALGLFYCAWRNRPVSFMLFILIGCAACAPSTSATPTDHALFLDVTCAKESRSENFPARAVGVGGASRGGERGGGVPG